MSRWHLLGAPFFEVLLIVGIHTYLGLHVLGYGGTQLSVPVLIMASPTAVVSYIMAQEMKGDGELAGSIVIGTTLFSLFTISGWLAFIQLVSA